MKKIFVFALLAMFLSLGSLTNAMPQETTKTATQTKKVESTTKSKKVKTVKSVKKESTKCDGCPEKSTCTKKEKK
jgi:hypothetical protein